MQRKAGVNMSDVKVNNRAHILDQLKDDRKSRKDIADIIKLTPAAVTILVNELMQEGCIQDSSRVDDSGNVGRKRVFIKLNKDYRYTVGVNIEPNYVSIGIANLKSEILKSDGFKVSPDMEIQVIIKTIATIIMDLLWKLNIPKGNVLGLGVGIVGIVDSREGVSKQAYGLWQEEVDIKAMLSSELQLPVVVENNVRALALAEMELTEHRNIKNMAFIKYGPGIGSAILVNEEVYKGSYNHAGEVGHMIIDIHGEPCKCGQRGCLETIASMESIIRWVKANYNAKEYPILNSLIEGDLARVDETTLLEAYQKGEAPIVKKVNQAMEYLGIGILNIMRLYDPSKIIIHGGLSRVDELMEELDHIIKCFGQDSDNDDKIERSILHGEKCIGGVVLANKELFFKTGGIVPELEVP